MERVLLPVLLLLLLLIIVIMRHRHYYYRAGDQRQGTGPYALDFGGS